MALDIVGPANAPNSITVRPADTRTFGASDTWAKDCTSPSANDGTKIQAGFLNAIIGQFRNAIRGNGVTASSVEIVTQDNSDDSMMLKSMQHLVQRGQMRCGVASGTNDIAVTLSPALAEYKQGIEIIIKIANVPTGAMTINVNALGAKQLLRRNGQPMQANDLLAGASYAMIYDGAAFRLATFAEGEVRRNVQNPTLYVRTDGNDSNDGSANDAAHAFKTITAAMGAAANTFDLVGRTLTVILGNAGTYSESVIVTVPQVEIRGNTTTAASYVISAGAVVSCVGSTLILRNVTLSNTGVGGQYTLQANYNGAVTLVNVGFTGSTAAGHIQVFFGGSITIAGAVTISGTCGTCFGAQGGSIAAQIGTTITVTGTPLYSIAFARAALGGVVSFGTILPTGTTTGPKFSVISNGVVDVAGSGVNALPGSSAGTTASGGQYV